MLIRIAHVTTVLVPRDFRFWSFSSPSGPSVWNDFNGDRFDWAVVCEPTDSSTKGFVSSARWKAQKQRVRDFSPLSYRARESAGMSALKVQCVLYQDLIDDEISRNCGI